MLEMVQPRPEARYVVFVPFANPTQPTGFVRVLWDSIDMADALHPQTLLAYGMNGEALPADHGAPVRLRVARQLGYKNTKYLSRLILTDSMDNFGKRVGSRSAEGGMLGTAAFESGPMSPKGYCAVNVNWPCSGLPLVPLTCHVTW
jgi:DMSO/TMAO reductase YedYZ molybdopterin-dependent catalytic subunit